MKTPERVAKAMLTLTRGYEQDPHAILLGAKFKEEYATLKIRYAGHTMLIDPVLADKGTLISALGVKKTPRVHPVS